MLITFVFLMLLIVLTNLKQQLINSHLTFESNKSIGCQNWQVVVQLKVIVSNCNIYYIFLIQMTTKVTTRVQQTHTESRTAIYSKYRYALVKTAKTPGSLNGSGP